jgi:hypothetical protein
VTSRRSLAAERSNRDGGIAQATPPSSGRRQISSWSTISTPGFPARGALAHAEVEAAVSIW